MTRVGGIKGWAALLLAAVSAAIVVALIGVVLDVGTAQAATATDATIEATSFTVNGGGNTGEGYAVCPGTTRAVGGGLVQSGLPNGLYVNASGPLDATGFTSQTTDGDIAKMWYAAVSNFGSSARTLKVFAICSGTSDATIEATSFTVNYTDTGEGYAVCPGTKRALGGGVVESGPPDFLYVRASGPLDATGFTSETTDGDIAKMWYAAVLNASFDGPRTFKVFAICQ